MSFQKAGFFVLSLVLLNLPGFPTESYGSPSDQVFREEMKGMIRKLSSSLLDPLSKNDRQALQTSLNGIVSETEKRGRPIRFGIGILDTEGLAIAGRYIVGTFKEEDFSRYHFLKKAFKQKKVILDRLFFQNRSEFLVICVPLVQKNEVIGALVLGFDPAEIKREYGLTAEQFMALDFNR